MATSILRKMKCSVCGRKLLSSKRQSYKSGKKYVGYCHNDSHPKLKFVIIDVNKNKDDPEADRYVDVKIQDSDW